MDINRLDPEKILYAMAKRFGYDGGIMFSCSYVKPGCQCLYFVKDECKWHSMKSLVCLYKDIINVKTSLSTKEKCYDALSQMINFLMTDTYDIEGYSIDDGIGGIRTLYKRGTCIEEILIDLELNGFPAKDLVK